MPLRRPSSGPARAGRPAPRRARRRCVAGALGGLALGLPAGAQTMVSPLVPRGHVRLDAVPSFTSWHSRFGLVSGADVVEELGSDLTDPTGKTLFPGLTTLEESLRELSGIPGYQATLGSTSADVAHDVTRWDLGVRVGVLGWLTVGAVVPYVKTNTALDVSFRPDSAGALGLNPAAEGEQAVTTLLDRLSATADAAAAHAASVCAVDPGPACDQAQALSARTTGFLDLTRTAYGASVFFPVGGSPMGVGLQGALAALNADLAAAGLSGVGVPMVFAQSILDEQGFLELPARFGSGYQANELRGIPGLWTLGDVELSADVRLLDTTPSESAGGSGFGVTLSGGATVRLPTGTVDDPSVFLDIGSGDGQMDIEGRGDAALRLGRWLGLSLGARYGTQRARTLVRRVAPHEQVLVPITRAHSVRWTPGAYLFLEASPRLRLTEDLALAVDFRRLHKSADTYEVFRPEGDTLPEIDTSELEAETEATVQEIAVGLRYSTVLSWALGRTRTPVEVGARWSSAVSGSGGSAPKTTRLELAVSLYRRLWGS